MDLSDIDLPADATVFLCGPPSFMRQVREALRAKGIAARNIHQEVIGTDL